jgi:nicotinamide-nucleotide amidase
MDPLNQAADELGRCAADRGIWVGVAESLTGGAIVGALSAVEGSSGWLRGGIVAYDSEVKHQLLDVPEGPVVTREAAAAMAASARRLLRADLAVAVTGAGGPAPQDGAPPGSVWVAVAGRGPVHAEHHDFGGTPEQVCRLAGAAALGLARRQVLDGQHLRLGDDAAPSGLR